MQNTHLAVPPPPQQSPMRQPCFEAFLSEKGEICSQHVQLGIFLICIVLYPMMVSTIVMIAQLTSSWLVEVFSETLVGFSVTIPCPRCWFWVRISPAMIAGY